MQNRHISMEDGQIGSFVFPDFFPSDRLLVFVNRLALTRLTMPDVVYVDYLHLLCYAVSIRLAAND